MRDLEGYLNSTAVRFLVTTQHQELDHPKAISVPLGLHHDAITAGFLRQFELFRADGLQRYPRKSHLLFLNFQCWSGNFRANVSDALELRFRAFNSYGLLDSPQHFYHGLARSKFVLCPSGMGVDSYRVWEAIMLGTVPVLESIGGGWQRSFEGLPVLRVKRFEDLTPELLERSYSSMLRRCWAGGWDYAPLTRRWWIDRVCGGDPRCWQKRRGDGWEDQGGAEAPCTPETNCC